MLNLIIWLVVGGLAGWVASKIMKTDEQMGVLVNIAVGVVGALLGGWVVGLFGYAVTDGAFNLRSILTAILGAVILLAILKAVRR